MTSLGLLFGTIASAAPLTAVTWTIREGPSGGTIAAGRYGAPSSEGTFHVVVASAADPGQSATATVTVAKVGAPGQWTNVTPPPSDINLNGASWSNGNFGVTAIAVDPNSPQTLYAAANYQGLYKSTDYGLTWKHVTTSGKAPDGCLDIRIAPSSPAGAPVIWATNLRGSTLGVWRSTDGGVTWRNWTGLPGTQDYAGLSIDPYDAYHILVFGHENNTLLEGTNAGKGEMTWRAVSLAGGMNQNGGTAYTNFIDMGNAGETAVTWIYLAQATNGSIGTWRTANRGQTWTYVNSGEKPHGPEGMYQPGNGVVYLGTLYGPGGWGLYRSADYGQTFTHVGPSQQLSVVWGTPSLVYAGYSWATQGTQDPLFIRGMQPGTGGFDAMTTPGGMTNGPAMVAVTNDGTHNVVVSANWLAGIWRYVE